MCGICGFIGHDDPILLTRMCRSMIHRGPDDEGTWFDRQARVGLGHRRLAIIDTSRLGRQPMCDASGELVISFNGEIYNFQDARDDLIKRGFSFKSQTDTEVLLYLYEVHGLDFLKKLNGMFALALWDKRRRRLVLARDHAGVKPLYYWRQKDLLVFASEIKALLKFPIIERRINLGAVPAYLACLWVPGRETMFDGIYKIEPGAMLVWEEGKYLYQRWFELPYYPDYNTSEAAWLDRIHESLTGAVRRQMISDVPLGAYLSGGLDSSGIVSYMKQIQPDIRPACYTVSFRPEELRQDKGIDELPYAKKVAGLLGVELKHARIGSDILTLLPKVVFHMDEPDADATAILTYIVSALAKAHGITVLLSGTGGDELFFGYRSHQAYRLFNLISFMPPWVMIPTLKMLQNLFAGVIGAQKPLVRRLKRFGAALGRNGIDRHMALVDWSHPDIRDALICEPVMDIFQRKEMVRSSIGHWFGTFKGRGDINRHSHILIHTFLAEHNFLYNDKCAMAVSVETRVPFMDVELMKLAASIPEHLKLKGMTTKYILKKAMARRLPSDVIYRPKRGFAPPLRYWITNQMRPLLSEFLSPDALGARGLFRAETVERVIKENTGRTVDHAYLLYALLSLEIWQQTFIDRPGVEITI